MSPNQSIPILLVVLGIAHCSGAGPSDNVAPDVTGPEYIGPEVPDASLLWDTPEIVPEKLGAQLMINELNANIDNGCDLVELVVTKAGSLQGIVLKERKASVFEGNVAVLAEDTYVVFHFNGGSSLCNPDASGSESISPAQFPAASYTGNLDSAFDVYVDDPGLVATDNVLSLYQVDGSLMDAVFVSDDPTGTAATDTESQASIVAEHGQWTTTSKEVPVGGFVDDVFNMHAVHDLNATSQEPWGQSLQRRGGSIDANHRGDWHIADNLPEATWGKANPL